MPYVQNYAYGLDTQLYSRSNREYTDRQHVYQEHFLLRMVQYQHIFCILEDSRAMNYTLNLIHHRDECDRAKLQWTYLESCIPGTEGQFRGCSSHLRPTVSGLEEATQFYSRSNRVQTDSAVLAMIDIICVLEDPRAMNYTLVGKRRASHLTYR
jgi:hypothetical protein